MLKVKKKKAVILNYSDHSYLFYTLFARIRCVGTTLMYFFLIIVNLTKNYDVIEYELEVNQMPHNYCQGDS